MYRAEAVRTGRSRRRSWILILLLVGLCWPLIQASAHFLLNLNVRIVHVDHRSDGLVMFVRMPMPYLVADKVGEAVDEGLPEPAPFTTNAFEDGTLVHFVDFAAVRADPKTLGRLLANGLLVETDDGPIDASVVGLRLHPLGTEPGFATLGEAEAVFADPAAWPDAEQVVYVGDAVVDVHLLFRTAAPVERYRLSSTLDPGLPGQEETANLILDSGPGGVQVFRARGLLKEPVEISRSALAAFGTFIVEGVRHILEGLDHVLFVVCLVAGATGLASLLWRVTGFTVGHSITLSLGFFGFVPSGAWFVPTVEWIIAVTILYAAYLAIRPRDKAGGRDEKRLFWITAFIGLIHGLGFSFVLQNILKVSSPNIWQSLLAFNVGIEIGQVLIVLVVSALIWLVARAGQRAERSVRVVFAAGAGAMAVYWVIERSAPLLATTA